MHDSGVTVRIHRCMEVKVSEIFAVGWSRWIVRSDAAFRESRGDCRSKAQIHSSERLAMNVGSTRYNLSGRRRHSVSTDLNPLQANRLLRVSYAEDLVSDLLIFRAPFHGPRLSRAL